jgi:hypothetical protein
MTWEIRNVSWQLPYNDSWRISQQQSKPTEVPYLFEHRDKLYIQPYGYTYYPTEDYKGRIINSWT